MLDFASEIFAELSDDVRLRILEAIEFLLSTYRNRHDSTRYSSYSPIAPDQVRRISYYSANLVTLRVALESVGGAVPLEKILGNSENTLDLWRSMVKLWECGLDHDSMLAIITTIARNNTNSIFDMRKPYDDYSRGRVEGSYEIALAQLGDRRGLERRLRYGAAIIDQYLYHDYDDGASWLDMMSSWLLAASASKLRFSPSNFMLEPPPADASESDIATVANLFLNLLESRWDIFDYSDPHLFRLISSLLPYFGGKQLPLAKLILAHPILRREVIELGNPEIYGHYARLVGRAKEPVDPRVIDFDGLPDEAIVAIQAILAGEPDAARFIPGFAAAD
jgi:hypothetical protein